MPLRRLPLSGALNVRDLGGYAVHCGKVTRFGALLRSDGLSALTDADIEALRCFGLSTVVDLRSPMEESQQPSRLTGVSGVEVIPCPISEDIENALPNVKLEHMGQMYLYMIDKAADRFVRALHLLADAPGAALFHCSAGKDRTGILAACVLKLCGVRDVDIVADYVMTPIYMKTLFEKIVTQHNIPPMYLLAEPEYITSVLRAWEARGGVRAWLMNNGADEGKLDRLVERMLTDE